MMLRHVVFHTYLPYVIEHVLRVPSARGTKILEGAGGNYSGDFVGSLSHIAKSFTDKHRAILFLIYKAQTESKTGQGIQRHVLEKEASSLVAVQVQALNRVLNELEEQNLIEKGNFSGGEETIRICCAHDYLWLQRDRILECLRWDALKETYKLSFD